MPIETGLQYNLEAIALSEHDAPYTVAVAENRQKQESEVSDLALDLGWQGGYRVQLDTVFNTGEETTTLFQDIAIYPEDRMSGIVYQVLQMEKGNSSYKIVDLTDPGLGTYRGAYAAYEVNKTGTSSLPSGKAEYYEIIFTKGKVFEVLRMTGPSADYATLQVFAKTAYKKL